MTENLNRILPSVVEKSEISTALPCSDNTDSKLQKTFSDTAIVVQLSLGGLSDTTELTEFLELVQGAGVQVLEIVSTKRDSPNAKYFVGSGKAQEIADLVSLHQANVVLINYDLTPTQLRNLAQLCQCRIVDRTGVILDIFAQRARSHEGKLQVELAQLKYYSTHLIGRKTGLDQQKGAVGLRGPGETQLETDRRLIRLRIKQLQQRLIKVNQQRTQNRQKRQKSTIPTLSLVGYTNAGKSSIFNALTQENGYVANQLFATLDPTLRQIQLPAIGQAILVDTVGFIRQLPHGLISAFKSTLQETVEACLLLHVVDCSDAHYLEHIDAVNLVLKEIGVGDHPILFVYNKIDQTDFTPHIEYDSQHTPKAVYLSAKTGEGIALLNQAIVESLNQQIIQFTLQLPMNAGKVRHLLYQKNAVIHEHITESGKYCLKLQIDRITWQKIQHHYGLSFQLPLI